jgi:hypothetical protein
MLDRQVALDLDDERRAGEDVGEEQAEQALVVAEGVAVGGHWKGPVQNAWRTTTPGHNPG